MLSGTICLNSIFAVDVRLLFLLPLALTILPFTQQSSPVDFVRFSNRHSKYMNPAVYWSSTWFVLWGCASDPIQERLFFNSMLIYVSNHTSFRELLNGMLIWHHASERERALTASELAMFSTSHTLMIVERLAVKKNGFRDSTLKLVCWMENK